MADLYEQWLEETEGRKGSFITNEEGRVVFIGGPGSGAGGSGSTGGITSETDLTLLDDATLTEYGESLAKMWFQTKDPALKERIDKIGSVLKERANIQPLQEQRITLRQEPHPFRQGAFVFRAYGEDGRPLSIGGETETEVRKRVLAYVPVSEFVTEKRKAFFYTDDEGRVRFAGGPGGGGGSGSSGSGGSGNGQPLPLHGDTVAFRRHVEKYAETPAGKNIRIDEVDRMAQQIARMEGSDKVQTHHYAEAAQYASFDSLQEIASRTGDSQIIERAQSVLNQLGL